MKQYQLLILIALLGLNRMGFAQENMEREDSILQWKNQVLQFVHSNLDSLYKLNSDDSRIHLLINLEEFVVNNDNGKHFRIGPNSIFYQGWFEELGYLKLFPEVIRLDSISLNFNGFKFFYRIQTIYDSMIEQSEVIAENLGYLAYRNPDKFLNFIESIDDIKEIQKIAGSPFWTDEGMADFMKAISKSKYYKEISEMILN